MRVAPTPLQAGLLHTARCFGGGDARAACSTSPRGRGGVDLQAEPLRSEANRVRGRSHWLRLAETPPPPGSFASLGIRPLPPPGGGGDQWHCRLLQQAPAKATALAPPGGGIRGG